MVDTTSKSYDTYSVVDEQAEEGVANVLNRAVVSNSLAETQILVERPTGAKKWRQYSVINQSLKARASKR